MDAQEEEEEEDSYNNDVVEEAEEDDQGFEEEPSLPPAPPTSSLIPATSKDIGASKFVSGFLNKSRLSFIGSWKRRYEALVDSLPAPSPQLDPKCRNRVLFHIDLDAFFCTASILAAAGDAAQSLHQKPVGVCWCSSSDSSSEISSCNYVARGFGIKAGMSLRRAREMCPELVTLPFDFDLYEELGLKFYQTLFAFSPHVEGVSCDEAFVDVTHLCIIDCAAPPDDLVVMRLANDLRAKISANTRGLTASIGCGKNKMLARLCTARGKPNGVFSSIGLPLEAVLHANLPVSALHSIGSSARDTLDRVFRCQSVVELQQIPLSALQQEFGPILGKRIAMLSRGEDDGVWTPRPERDSVSVQISWGVRMDTMAQVDEFLRELSEQVHVRLEEKRGNAVNIRVWRAVKNQPEHMRKGKIGHGVCDILTRTTRYKTPLGTTADSIVKAACELFRQTEVVPEDVRGLGVSVSGLLSKHQHRARQHSQLQQNAGGIAAWLGGSASAGGADENKRVRVDCLQKMWSTGDFRRVIDRELAYAFEAAARCEAWPGCGERMACCGESNRHAIRECVLPLVRGLVQAAKQAREDKPSAAATTTTRGGVSAVITYTRLTSLRLYGENVLPDTHALVRFARAGGGVVFLEEMLDDLEEI